MFCIISFFLFVFEKGGKPFPEKNELSDSWVKKKKGYLYEKQLLMITKRRENKMNYQVMGNQRIHMDY